MPGYLVDTGPLFEYLLNVYSRSAQRPELVRKANVVRSARDWNCLARFFRNNGPFITVSGVFVELGYLFRKRLRRRGGDFWNAVVNETASLDLTDPHSPFQQLDLQILREVGPVDAALLNHSRSYDAQRNDVRILTSDRQLFGICQKKQLPVTWFQDVLWPTQHTSGA